MKSVIAAGIAIASLIQGLAQAQVFDLPEPGASVDTVEDTPSPELQIDQAQYAASLRLGRISRKEDGTLFRILLEPTRLQRIDTRIAFGKVRLREGWLVTESGVRLEIQKHFATGVLETSSLYRSENFSLNENIKEIHLLAEAFSENAELIVTAVSESSLPKLSLWQPRENVNPLPVSGAAKVVTADTACTQEICVGDVVIYQRQRAKVVQVLGNGQVVILQRGVRKVALTKVLKRPLVPPYRG